MSASGRQGDREVGSRVTDVRMGAIYRNGDIFLPLSGLREALPDLGGYWDTVERLAEVDRLPRAAPATNPVEVVCSVCGRVAVLPPVPGKPGYVSIEPMTDWLAAPIVCPDCQPKDGHGG